MHVTVPPDVMVRDIEGRSFILNIQTECYFSLDAVGARMFQVLGEGESLGEALDRLQREFDVDPATLRADLERLITELLANGLLTTDGTAPRL